MTRLKWSGHFKGKAFAVIAVLVLVLDSLALLAVSDDDDLLESQRAELASLKREVHLTVTRYMNGDIELSQMPSQLQSLVPDKQLYLLDHQLQLITTETSEDKADQPELTEKQLQNALLKSKLQASVGSFQILKPEERWLAFIPLVLPSAEKSSIPAYLILPLDEPPTESLWNNEVFPLVLFTNFFIGGLIWLAYRKQPTPIPPSFGRYLSFSPEPLSQPTRSALLRGPVSAQSDAQRYMAQSEFTVLLNSIPDAAMIIDQHKKILEINAATAELLNEEPDKLAGQYLADLFTLNDRSGNSLLARSAEQLLPNRGDILNFSDCQFAVEQGVTRLVSITLSCLSRDLKGERRAVLIISDDSAIEQMRYESQQQKYLLNAMFNHTPALVYLKDRRSVYLMANSAFAEQVGRPQTDIIGSRPESLFEGEALQDLQSLEAEVLENKTPCLREIEHNDAQARTFLYQEFPLKDSKGQVLYIGGIASDVTAERQLEHTLEALATDSSAASGDTFFSSLVRQVQKLTHADFVFIGDMVDHSTQMVVSTARHKSEPYPPFCYYCQGTPFEITLNGNSHTCSDLRRSYSDNYLLQELDVDYYLGAPLFDDHGQTIGIIGLMFKKQPANSQWLSSTLDLFTGRLSAELSRERLQRHLQHVSFKLSSHIQNTPLAVIEWSKDFEILDWNRSAEKLFGYTAEEAIGNALNRLIIAPIRWAYDSAILGHIVTNKTNNKCTHTNVNRDGDEVMCEWESTVILNEMKEVESVISVIKNVTAERRLLFQIQQKEKEQRQMLNSMVDAIITIDSKGMIQSFNKSASDLFGYSESEILGKNVNRLMPQEVARHHDGYLAEYARSGRARFIGTNREVTGLKSDGSEFPMRLSVNKLPSSDKSQSYFIGSCIDITEEKQKDEQLRHSMKMDALGRLTGGVAHDFNNILGIISGYAELLDMTATDDDTRQYANEIVKASHRGERLTSRLLKFTRKRAAEPKAIDVNAALEEQRDMLQRSLTPRIEINFNLTPNLPLIAVDVSEFEDALLNLCINAKHAMEGQGRLTIETSQYYGHAKSQGDVLNRDWIVLQVSDEGIGMTEDVKQRLFEPFFSTKDEEKGTGLGLSQVYGFVERAQGFIDVESEPGEGATFRIYFPAVETETPRDKDKEDTTMTPYHGNERLLVVDDEVALADVLTTTLKHYGYQLVSANSAEQGLKILKEQNIDLVISDVVMKHMSGFELATQVKQDYQIPVLLISGYYDESERRSNNHSYTKLIHKPFSARTLLDAIRQTLDENGEIQ